MSAVDEPPTLQDAPEEVQELPPSCRLVWMYLAYEGSAQQSEIASATGSPPRTVRYALKRLENAGAVENRRNVGNDARKVLWEANTGGPDDSAT